MGDWEDREFCKMLASEREDRKLFVDLAYELLNLFSSVIDEFYAAAGDSNNNPYMKHIDGRILPKVEITDDLPAGTAARAAKDGLGTGHIWLNRSWFDCLLAIFETTGEGEGWGALNLVERVCALVDLAVTGVAHETGHVVWRGENFCSGLEGFVRHRIQEELGYFTGREGIVDPRCCQTSWSCGGDTTSDECSGSNLQNRERSIPECTGECFPS